MPLAEPASPWPVVVQTGKGQRIRIVPSGQWLSFSRPLWFAAEVAAAVLDEDDLLPTVVRIPGRGREIAIRVQVIEQGRVVPEPASAGAPTSVEVSSAEPSAASEAEASESSEFEGFGTEPG